jgi:hypothetical protein
LSLVAVTVARLTHWKPRHYYPLNDRLALVPAFYAIFNANNFDSNPKLYVGNLRAQFSF